MNNNLKLLALLLVLLPVLLGGRTASVSEIYERHYVAEFRDSGVVSGEAISPCGSIKALGDTVGTGWCPVGAGEDVTIEIVTVAVLTPMDGADEDCILTIQTTPSTTGTITWTTHSSSEIMMGPNLSNTAGNCKEGTTSVSLVGESCTRMLDDGVIAPAGGAWRFLIGGGGACTRMQGVGVYVTTTVQ